VTAYYNENDPFAAAWLRELIKEDLIALGEVDERSIEEVEPDDLRGFTQCHFFAGIGVWSYALRNAGWSDDRSVWTGSSPCQPWSIANVWQGGGKGHEDQRDLWPCFFRLIRERKPSEVFGEQVTGAIRWGWLDRAFDDLEKEGYACGAKIMRASAVGADHERKRIFFVAHSGSARRERHQQIERVPVSAATAFAVDGDPFVRARRALAGDYSDLLPCDGLSVQLERNALKVYGNAIVPQVAQAFIEAYMDIQ
jgi:DNA (cytosine-5)-methyltransferase 1